VKQAIILRKDVEMGKGKAAAQASHASLEAYKKASADAREEWESEGQKKIVLKADSEKQLIEIFMSAKKHKLPAALISDAGHTQVEPGTKTAVAIGPASDEEIDKIVGRLKLY
jgi:peptidyl-tRNA hydrolase, PTH2 family